MTGTPGETDWQFLDDPGFEPAASFDRFYAGTHRSLLAQLTAMTGDPAEAQDCLEEGYMRAWARWERVGDTVQSVDDQDDHLGRTYRGRTGVPGPADSGHKRAGPGGGRDSLHRRLAGGAARAGARLPEFVGSGVRQERALHRRHSGHRRQHLRARLRLGPHHYGQVDLRRRKRDVPRYTGSYTGSFGGSCTCAVRGLSRLSRCRRAPCRRCRTPRLPGPRPPGRGRTG